MEANLDCKGSNRKYKCLKNLTSPQKRKWRMAQKRRYEATRVHLGSQVGRWIELKKKLGLKSDIEVARVLIDRFEETEPTTSQIATSIIIVEPPDETTSGEVVDADFNISDIEPLEDRLLPATTASTSKESPQGSQLDINIDYEVRGDYVYLSSSNNTLR
ncbi:uncharacterized protein [Apostichopus japonicus]|uniref:uncharacterized protein isoform X2 n=1 Tax=Stichopus japonicus TaxID=307972 RepID=UPI003AB58408